MIPLTKRKRRTRFLFYFFSCEKKIFFASGAYPFAVMLMNPCETAAAVTALAILLHQNLSDEASAYLAAVFVSLGDQLTLLAAAEACRNQKE